MSDIIDKADNKIHGLTSEITKANSIKRRAEKIDLFINWLVIFHHSTTDIILSSMGLKINGQRNFIKAVENRGFLNYLNNPISKRKLVMLSPEGKRYALTLSEKAIGYSTEPSRISYNQLYHHLSIQKAVANIVGKGNDIIDYMSTRTVDFSIAKGKKPDAVVVYGNGDKLSLEVELTHKTPSRSYRALLDSALAILDKKVNHVMYVFASETLCEYYKSLFAEKEWSVYKSNKYGKLADSNQKFRIDDFPDLRNSFSFVYNPDLK